MSLMRTLKAPSMSSFGIVTLQDPGDPGDTMSKLMYPKEYWGPGEGSARQRVKLKF